MSDKKKYYFDETKLRRAIKRVRFSLFIVLGLLLIYLVKVINEPKTDKKNLKQLIEEARKLDPCFVKESEACKNYNQMIEKTSKELGL